MLCMNYALFILGFVVPGAGAFEIAATTALNQISDVKGKVRLGVKAFSDAMLIVPKVLGKFTITNLCLR